MTEIYSWHESSESQIYTLEGLAGIGKSTVARTVAQEMHRRGLLGASFFFSRSEDDRKSAKLLFGTIAFQLSQYSQEIALRIGEALGQKPDASGKQLQDQLRDLIIQPLQSCEKASKSTILILIDALDECDSQDAERLLSLFLREIHKVPNLKIFFTTRSERHILNLLLRYKSHQLYRLHDIESSVVEGDVRRYLLHELSSQAVEAALPELEPPPWTPSSSELNTLINAADKLFIIASTSIKFLLDDIRCNPKAQMRDLMKAITAGKTGITPLNTLDGVYSQILSIAIPSNSFPDILSRFHSVVGTIVLLRDPLPVRPLAILLQTDTNDVKGALVHLQSIIFLTEPEDTPRIYHKSFPDFITNAKRCSHDPRFHVSIVAQHAYIARNCFRVMDEQLCANICGLKFPEKYLDNNEIQHLLSDRISRELQYACLHWATHLFSAEKDDDLFARLEKFSFTHLLHWLEVLSLIGRLEVGYIALDHAKRFAVGGFTRTHQTVSDYFHIQRTSENSKHVEEILNDTYRLLSRFHGIIRSSAQHVYHSALSFTPPDTRLHQTYSSSFPNRITVTQGIPRYWSPLVAVLRGHSESVNVLSFSPDGSRLASGSYDKTVRLWDGATGIPIATLDGHSEPVTSISFSPDGSRLASGSYDKTVRLWDGSTGLPIATLNGHSESVTSISFSPDGFRLASGSYDKTVRLWDGASGVLIATLEGHLILPFSPDGSEPASGLDDNIARLWDGSTGAPIATLEGHSQSVSSLLFSPDGSRLASGLYDETVTLWDCVTGVPISTLVGHSGYVTFLSFSPDGSQLASGSYDKTVRLWDGFTGVPTATLEGHSQYVTSLSFSPDGSRFASGSSDRTVRLWDGATGAPIATLEGHSHSVRSLSFSPDSSRLASGSYDKTVRLWDGSTGVPVATLEGHSKSVASVIFSPDGSRLASGSSDKTATLWDCTTGVTIATLKGHSGPVRSLTFSPDGSRLASGSYDKTVKLWNCTTGIPIATLDGHSYHVISLAFSPDGSQLASGSYENTVRLWDGFTGVPIATLEGHSHCVVSLTFSPDGSQLALGSSDMTVRLWDGVSKVPFATFEGHSACVTSLSFSPDGSRLASGSSDKTVRLWDVSTGVTIATLKGHSECITSLSFSPDGSRLASGSDNKAVKLWDAATGTLIATLDGHPQSVYSLSHSLLASQPISTSTNTILRHQDGHTDGSFSSVITTSDWFSSSKVPSMSLLMTKDPSRHYYIQCTVSRSNGHVPLLWLPVDIQDVKEAFCSKAVAFGCRNSGRVVILNLTQLNLQETVVT